MGSISRMVQGELKDIGVGGLFMAVDTAGHPLFPGRDVAQKVSYPNPGKLC